MILVLLRPFKETVSCIKRHRKPFFCPKARTGATTANKIWHAFKKNAGVKRTFFLGVCEEKRPRFRCCVRVAHSSSAANLSWFQNVILLIFLTFLSAVLRNSPSARLVRVQVAFSNHFLRFVFTSLVLEPQQANLNKLTVVFLRSNDSWSGSPDQPERYQADPLRWRVRSSGPAPPDRFQRLKTSVFMTFPSTCRPILGTLLKL